MAQERFKLMPCVVLVLKKDNQVLIAKRKNTNWYDGYYALPGGGVDGNETVPQAAAREAQEELNIMVRPEDVRVAHAQHHIVKQGHEAIAFFVEITRWQGQVCNVEPDKCEHIKWVPASELPQDMVPHAAVALEYMDKNIFYSDYEFK